MLCFTEDIPFEKVQKGKDKQDQKAAYATLVNNQPDTVADPRFPVGGAWTS